MNKSINESLGLCESCLQNVSISIQTVYKDNEAQTVPWEPSITSENSPAVLTLTSLTWNNGLPAGIDELNTIKKIDIKTAWELVLPSLDCSINFKRYKNIITELDKDKWTFRDKELQLTVDSNFNWIDKMIKIKNCEQRKKLLKRFEKFGKYLNFLKNKKINRMKFEHSRELKKLMAKYNKEYLEYNLLKNENNLSLHENRMNLVYGRKIFKANYGTNSNNPIKCNKLCLRVTKWTEDKLKTLQVDLRKIRLNVVPNKINCL